MKYTFNIDNNIKNNKIKEKNNITFYLNFYNFLNNYKRSISLLISVIMYFIIAEFHRNDLLFHNNKIQIFILCICFSNFIFGILEIFFSTKKLYKKVSDFLDYDIFIRELTVFNDLNNDKLKESSIVPAIKIKYDIKKASNEKFALIFRITEDQYKVIDIIYCDRFENKIERNIYSDKILKYINETDKKCVDEKGVLLAHIVLLNNNNVKIGDIISPKDINTNLLLTELFFFPYIHNKKEGIG